MATIGKMAAMVAHEINNPLSGILTYSRVVKRWIQNNFSDGTARRRNERLARPHRQRKQALRRTGEEPAFLLARHAHEPRVVRPEAGHRPLRAPGPAQDGYGQHPAEPALGEELPNVRCDPTRLSRLCSRWSLTLLMLCRKAAIFGSPPASTRHHARAVIRDDGMGIPEEHMAHMFEPFYTTKESGGSGLAWPSARTLSSATAAVSQCSPTWGREPLSQFCPVDSQRITLPTAK